LGGFCIFEKREKEKRGFGGTRMTIGCDQCGGVWFKRGRRRVGAYDGPSSKGLERGERGGMMDGRSPITVFVVDGCVSLGHGFYLYPRRWVIIGRGLGL